MFFNSKLGRGFIQKNNIFYFDKDKFLTLGNGDELEIEKSKSDRMIENNENFSEFLAIFQTLIFFTDPSESNLVLFDFPEKKNYQDLLEELFPTYKFLSSFDEENLIVFCGEITKNEYPSPYLVMGRLKIVENTTFNDGTLLRPIYGEKLRMMIKGGGKRKWNYKEIRKLQNYHLDKVRKEYKFFDPLEGVEILDFDHAGVRFLLVSYLKKANLDLENFKELEEKISNIFYTAHSNSPDIATPPF